MELFQKIHHTEEAKIVRKNYSVLADHRKGYFWATPEYDAAAALVRGEHFESFLEVTKEANKFGENLNDSWEFFEVNVVLCDPSTVMSVV